MDHESLKRHRQTLLAAMPSVRGYIATFTSINKRWDGAITAGLIETGRMKSEAAHLFGPLIQDMGSTKQKFEELQESLVDAIVYEMVNKVVLELTDAAKFAINILKRNLFERTADVGYLAMDWELCDFLAAFGDPDRVGQDPANWAERQRFIQDRLAQYQYEYTVYNEIILLDLEGRVAAHLDLESPIRASSDPLLAETLEAGNAGSGEEPYVETFGPTDLRPGKGNVLIYSQAMRHPDTGQAIGVLCLCFDFEDEMQGIFQDLGEGGGSAVVSILDREGRVIASSDASVLALGHKAAMVLDEDFRMVAHGGHSHVATTVRTDGYQGFLGLEWYGHAMIPVDAAFGRDENGDSLAQVEVDKLRNISADLENIKQEAEDILDDMKLDSLNGQVKAAKYEADGFVEVLRFVNMIGDEINAVFSSSILNLQQTVVSSLFRDLCFRAFQGNNIADRNLYERANDVCWWALTPLFRKTLATRLAKGAALDEAALLRDNLQYINDLYTPYLRLLLAAPDGEVVAVSDPPEGLVDRCVQGDCPEGQGFVGRRLDARLLKQALELKSHREYCVSEFTPTETYGNRPTYVYSTAVRDPEHDAGVVGVIQIVFDGEPQFAAMLSDVLPRGENKSVKQGAFAVYTDRRGKVVSSTSDAYPPGQILPVDAKVLSLDNGERMTTLLELDGHAHAVGCHVSSGYREYKRRDGYVNDMVCLVFVPI